MGLSMMTSQCFAHGQPYTAFSRVTKLDGIRVYSPHTCRGDSNFIINIVYTELLDNCDVYPTPQHNDLSDILNVNLLDCD